MCYLNGSDLVFLGLTGNGNDLVVNPAGFGNRFDIYKQYDAPAVENGFTIEVIFRLDKYFIYIYNRYTDIFFRNYILAKQQESQKE